MVNAVRSASLALWLFAAPFGADAATIETYFSDYRRLHRVRPFAQSIQIYRNESVVIYGM